MKILKWVFVIIGLAGVIAGSVLLVKNLWTISVIYRVAVANQSAPSVQDPSNWVMWMTLAAALGGLCLGMGLAWPTKLRGTIQKELLASSNTQSAGSSAGYSAPTPNTPEPPSIPGSF